LAYWGPYAASKAALEHLTLTYAAEIRQTSIRANLIDPGAVRTKMRAQAFPGEDPTSLPTPEAITDLFVELAGAKAPQGRIIRV
ncbi:MAG: SDR family NAD(P)-dependent oxidoreductase, partial [Alphaproteobacteria bacterium]